jgi:acetyl esterase/lipase
MKISRVILFILLLSGNIIYAQQTAIPLYPGKVPNSKPAPSDYIEKDTNGAAYNVFMPTLTPFLPEKGKANGSAVIICPGGGYRFLSMDKEGYKIAKEFNKHGITAFVLKYRLPSDLVMQDMSIAPLQDAQRSVQMVRERAGEWGVDTARIGIMGFSAGGHLASTAGTHFDKALIDNPKHIGLRPNFMLLVYPVISFGEFTHTGSRTNLIGKELPSNLVTLFSNEQQVTPHTPVTFIVHAQDDKTVPVQNALLFYSALLKNNVKAEMHLYMAGGHGFGLNNKTTRDNWFERCINFLNQTGMMGSK